MAGDWIKMRMGFRTHPKVVRISYALQADRLRVIGALYAVWSLADEHTEDGSLPGYSLTALDESIGFPGFGQAMKDVEWLLEKPQGLVLPRFDEHNGASAKRRSKEAKRQRKSYASDARKMRTREEEEKRESREEEQQLPVPIPVTAARDELADLIWVEGLRLLTEKSGQSDKSARAILGGWMKLYGKEEVARAVSSSMTATDPVKYMGAVLSKRSTTGDAPVQAPAKSRNPLDQEPRLRPGSI